MRLERSSFKSRSTSRHARGTHLERYAAWTRRSIRSVSRRSAIRTARRNRAGICGGFGRGTLGPWGEDAVKAFVREALDEALKLENALARLRTERRVALLHYSPIRDTVEGEPPEILPFLGCSRLEEPLERWPV